jgi:hypothetical protein
MYSKAALFVITALCLSLFSCAGKAALKRAEVQPYTGPVTIEILKESVGFGKVRSIKALAGVRITKQGAPEGTLNGVFGYKAPGRMRIDLFGPFGLTVTEILISAERFQLSVPSKKVLYEWNSPGFTFPNLPEAGFRYEMGEEDDRYVLLAGRDDGESDVTARYYFDRTYLLNRSISIYKDGSEVLYAEFNDFNARIPQRMKVVFSNGLALDISLDEPEFDSDIPDNYFSAIEHGDKKIKSIQEVFKGFAPVR